MKANLNIAFLLTNSTSEDPKAKAAIHTQNSQSDEYDPLAPNTKARLSKVRESESKDHIRNLNLETRRKLGLSTDITVVK